MAKILENHSNTASIKAYADVSELYGANIIDGFIGGRLVEKQNEFNKLMEELVQNAETKDGKAALGILPQTIKIIKEYAEKLAENLETKEQRTLFMRFAEAKGSRTLTILKKIAENKTEQYKREQILLYCAFLIKSSKDLYDDPQVLSENAAYYGGYIRLLEEYANADTVSIAINAIYSAAIEAALEKGDSASPRVYLADKNIATALTEEKCTEIISAANAIDERNIQNAIIERFNPQTVDELKKNTAEVEYAIKKGLLTPQSGEKIARDMGVIFNVNMKNRSEKERENEEKTTLAIIGKIICASVTPQDVINSDLNNNVKDMIIKIIETENANNTKTLRERKKLSMEKLAKAAKMGEIVSINDIAASQDDTIDAACLLQTIKLIKEYRNEKYGIYQEKK